MEIVWVEEEQCFITIPDGDKATHKQIRDYYNAKLRAVLEHTMTNKLKIQK